MTFIFYDTEATGLEPAFDQIVQFAAIITDDNLSTIEELNRYIRLRDQACLTVSRRRKRRARRPAIALIGARSASVRFSWRPLVGSRT